MVPSCRTVVAVGEVGVGTAIQLGGSEWRDYLEGSSANHCDYAAAVAVVNLDCSRAPDITHLLLCLFLYSGMRPVGCVGSSHPRGTEWIVDAIS